MKVKNKLYLISAVSIGLFILIAITINTANNKMKAAIMLTETLSKIQNNLSALSAVTYEFLLYKEERMLAQWEISYNSTLKLSEISEETLDILEEHETIESLRSNILSMKDIFTNLKSITLERRVLADKGASEDKLFVMDSLEARLTTRLQLKMHNANLDSLILDRFSQDIAEAVRKKANAVVIFSLLLYTVYLATALFLTYRSIASPLEKLIKGAEIIGSGNLDHRIGIHSKDEFGKLSNAFNLMITERKRAEVGLQVSEEKFRGLTETTCDWIWEVDENAVYTYSSPKVSDLLGYGPEEVIDKIPFDLMPPDEARRVADIFGPIAVSQKPFSYLENTNLHKDGSFVVLESSGVPIFDKEGIFRGYRGIDRDISERKRSEDAIRESELKYRTVFENSKDGISIYERAETSERRLVDCNPSYVRMSGRTKEELLLLEDIRTLQKSGNPEFDTAAIQQKVAGGEPYWGTFSWKRPDGKENYIEYEAVPLQLGTKAYIYVIDRDITARKKAEDVIRESEAQLKEAQKIASIGNWDLDLSDNRLFWSDEIYRIFEIDPEEFGTSYEEFLSAIHPDDRAMVDKAYTDSHKDKSPYEIVHRLLMPDGRIKHVHERCITHYDADGNPVRSFGTVQDITESKRAEEEIHKLNEELEQRVRERTAQLEAVNQELESFAYSVSHDLRAPLRSIDGFSHAIVKQYSDSMDKEAQNLFNRVRAATKRMSELIDNMLNLSRVTRSEIKMTEVDLTGLARNVVEDLRNAEPERKVSFELMDGISVRGDMKLLQTVVENLLGNAWKFTSGKESARIEFGREDQDDRQVFYVRDNGAGFDMTYSNKLFVPFQRLHSVKEFPGTGVGLASVKRIIARHGGEIWAEGRVGEGATLFFTL